MSLCNHTWRDTPLPHPKENKAELLASIKKADIHGWWLKGTEFNLVTELVDQGIVQFCKKCEGDKAAIIKEDNDK
jgi:hypothetical protein